MKWDIFDAIIFGIIALVIDIALAHYSAPTITYIIPVVVLIGGLNYSSRKRNKA